MKGSKTSVRVCVCVGGSEILGCFLAGGFYTLVCLSVKLLTKIFLYQQERMPAAVRTRIQYYSSIACVAEAIQCGAKYN